MGGKVEVCDGVQEGVASLWRVISGNERKVVVHGMSPDVGSNQALDSNPLQSPPAACVKDLLNRLQKVALAIGDRGAMPRGGTSLDRQWCYTEGWLSQSLDHAALLL
jgi:hypothetical protein